MAAARERSPSPDIEQVQAILDRQFAEANQLVASWMQASASSKPKVQPKGESEQELRQWRERPPTLGLGAPIPSATKQQSTVALTGLQRQLASGLKRKRDDAHEIVVPQASAESDEEESRTKAVGTKKARLGMGILGGKGKAKSFDTRINGKAVKANGHLSASPFSARVLESSAPDTSTSKLDGADSPGPPASTEPRPPSPPPIATTSFYQSLPTKKKKKKRSLLSDSINIPVQSIPHSPSKPTNLKKPFRIPMRLPSSDEEEGQERELSIDMPNNDSAEPEAEAEPDEEAHLPNGVEVSPKKKRKRKRKRKSKGGQPEGGS